MKNPKVFISYSWSPEENANWVKELGQRLTSDGVHVVLDIWDLKEGQDKYVFMERMVSDESIDKVLLICNESYAEKANKRKGGVGDESLIITPKIYEDVSQEKFIPIVRGRDENGKTYLPNFIASRLYVDMSANEWIEESYEKLLRLIYNKPSEKRPPIGSPPPFITEDDPVFIRTYYLLGPIENALRKGSESSEFLIKDYYRQFLEALDDFRVEEKENYSSDKKDLDELYYVEIERMHELMKSYKSFLGILLNYQKYFNIETFENFLEDVAEFNVQYKNKDLSKGINRLTGAHVSFIRYELFLYSSMLLLKNKCFDILDQILMKPYYIKENQHTKIKPFYYNIFCFPNYLFEYRNIRLKLSRVNLRADLIKSRTESSKEFSLLQEADAILFYRSLLDSVKPITFYSGDYNLWHPDLSAYYLNLMPNLERLISRSFFSKFKVILGVKSKEELTALIEELGENSNGRIRAFHYNIPHIKNGLQLIDICKYP